MTSPMTTPGDKVQLEYMILFIYLCMVDLQINGAPDKRDANLLSELEQYYDNTTRNFAEQVQFDSQYYETDEIKPVLYKNKQFKYHTLHLNIQGLMSSLDHLKHLIHKLETNHIHIDFILVCETFLHGIYKDKTFSKLCEISGYKFVYKNRINRAKGGVGLYIKNDYQFKARDDLSTFIEGEFETIFVEVKSKPNNLIIGEVYRVPNTSDELSIKRYDDALTKVLANKHNDAILASDQNYDYIKINEHRHTSELFDTFISHGLIPTITRHTYYTHYRHSH